MGIDHSRPEVLYEVQRVDGHICSISRDKNNPQFMCIREENLGREEETCHTIDIANGETLDVCYRNRNFTPGRRNGDAFTPVISSNEPKIYDNSGNNTYVTPSDQIERINLNVDRRSDVIFGGIPGNRDKCTNITVNQYLGQRPETHIIRTEQNGPVTQPVPNEMNGQMNQCRQNGQMNQCRQNGQTFPINQNRQTDRFGQNGQTFPINQNKQGRPIIQNRQINQSGQNGRSGMNGLTKQINGTPAIFENTGNNDNLGWSPTRLEYTDNLSIISRNNRNNVVNPLNRSELRRLT